MFDKFFAYGSYPITEQPNPWSSLAVARPVAPQPRSPQVSPDSSRPGVRTQPPSRVATSWPGTFRSKAKASPSVNSPTLTAFAPSPATTTTPAASAALISILSNPTPALAITFSFGAAAIISAVTFVRLRTTNAVASFNEALSSSGLLHKSSLRVMGKLPSSFWKGAPHTSSEIRIIMLK